MLGLFKKLLILKSGFSLFLLFFIVGCANKQIILKPNQKIALEGINKKEFCQKDYSTGYIGGCLFNLTGGISMGSLINGYLGVAAGSLGVWYVAYSIADYNKKPIELEYVLEKGKFKKTIFLIDKYLKECLPKNYVSVNNLKFPEIKKPEFYYKKIEKFAKLNNLSYTIFIYLDNKEIEWDIYNNHHILQKVITTKCPNGDLKVCVKKFIKKIKNENR
jgi:hypothetical protein